MTQPPEATAGQLTALTSDPTTLRDGRKLAVPGRWSQTGGAESVVWGACQGSGKSPYRVCLDTVITGYKCSCPSRKQPCKHVAALGLLYAEQPSLFTAAAPPDWVEAWQANRAKRRAATAASSPPDTEAQAQRINAREQKVRSGMHELKLWLQDLIRSGLTDERVQTYAFWDQIAARMVDAQASSVGRKLRSLATIPIQGRAGWAERLLDELSSLYLLADAYARLDTLERDVQADIRTSVGWTIKQEDILSEPAVSDVWHVMGQALESEDRLHTRRVWLHGQRTTHKALLLDFSFGSAKFENHFTTGSAMNAALVFYPSAYPLRAVLKQRMATVQNDAQRLTGFDCGSINEALGRYADALARNPWVSRIPVGFRGVTPYVDGERLLIRDEGGHVWPMKARKMSAWEFTAASGNQPVPIFGEWDGYTFFPQTLLADGLFYPC